MMKCGKIETRVVGNLGRSEQECPVGPLLATVRAEANAAYDNGGCGLPRPAARRQDVREARRSALSVRKKVPGKAREKAKILGR